MSREISIGIASGVVTASAIGVALWYKSKIKTTDQNQTNPKPHDNEIPTIPIPELRKTGPTLNFASEYDNIYEKRGPKPFQFNREVVRVFDDMISRSVPLYRECMYTLLYWVSRYYKSGSVIYDLGMSTGSTIDLVAQSLEVPGKFVGIDNSSAMVEKAKEKLVWMKEVGHEVDIVQGDMMQLNIENATVVIMNYTLQFIPVVKRKVLLQKIYDGLLPGSIFYLSEKVRSDNKELQETCTWIYEDFKHRRGYTKTEIARKKEALMNVLVPNTEAELFDLLKEVGFDAATIALKWNNFTTFVAIKSDNSIAQEGIMESQSDGKQMDNQSIHQLFDSHPEYMDDLIVLPKRKVKKGQPQPTKSERQKQHESEEHTRKLQELLCFRDEQFYSRSVRASLNYEKAAECLLKLPKFKSSHVTVSDNSILEIGLESELTSDEDKATLNEFLNLMKPWKKGPLKLFGVEIDTEWRSDWKWNRLADFVGDLSGKTVADLGCANGYFMYRMLFQQRERGLGEPKLLVGIDPNMKAWLEFEFFQKFAQEDALKFEVMDGDCMDKMNQAFDVVFCLGVLYHTTDPMGMLRKIWASMKPGAKLIVDCQGIPGDESVALVPRSRYANAKGIWFLPTLSALNNWLARANFGKIKCIFSEPLSKEEQRSTSQWANIRSLHESLDETDPTKTVEGYPAPYRYYVTCVKGG